MTFKKTISVRFKWDSCTWQIGAIECWIESVVPERVC